MEGLLLILIGGGSRSGKSHAALAMLNAAGPRIGFIATAQAFDDEMHARIAAHRNERGADVITWEEPLLVAERIQAESKNYDAILVDCLTLWLSNLMLAGTPSLQHQYQKLIDYSVRASARIIFVTNEVGCGIVPENALARQFRDEAGRLNQLVAQHADEVHWMVFGIGMRIK